MNGYGPGLVPVRWYDDPLEAHLARCLLENEGIEAFVHDEHIIGLNRALSYALGQVKLKVHETDRRGRWKCWKSPSTAPTSTRKSTPSPARRAAPPTWKAAY